MSSVRDLLNGSNKIYGSFSDACLLPNGDIALSVWNSGRLGLTQSGFNYPIVILKRLKEE